MRTYMVKALLIGAVCSGLIACSNVGDTQLPKTAEQFLSEHYSDVPVSQIMDTITQMGYTAILENGTEIDFDETGEWEEINFKRNEVPASIYQILPSNMSSYLKENYANASIRKITKKNYGRNKIIYRVTFNKPNKIEICFTKDGTIISNDPEGKRIPSVARNLISQFEGTEVSTIYVDVDGDIEVELDDKTEIEFDRKGNWYSVKTKNKAMPDNFLKQLPNAMIKYVTKKHPDQFIRRVEKKSYGYRIRLNKPNDIELSFTKTGILISEESENE
jgi:Protein of unknown function (DUF2874).